MPRTTIRIGQSADPDDAFMAWGLPAVLAELGIEGQMRFDDIESLNLAAAAGELDLTAISVAAYVRLSDRYRMLRAGASFGEGYGPVVVAKGPARRAGPKALAGLRVATPGAHTTAKLLLRIYAGDTFEAVEMGFDRILPAVQAGEVDAGLIIHEGQLLYEELGLSALFEPALRWAHEEELPLPLGAVVVRRELPAELQQQLASGFARAIHRGFENHDEALDFAARWARGLDRPTLREYVHRYVNAATLDMGGRGQRAIERLFEMAAAAGVIDEAPRLDLI